MELKAQKREITGKKVRKLRRAGEIPAVVFGADKVPQNIKLPALRFEKAFREAGESTVLDLDIDGQKEKAIITDVQIDPMGKVIHADLKRVEAGEKLTANVPIEVIGESPVVKSGDGILLTLLDEVEVECLPQDLPAKIEVDISGLEKVEDMVTIKDLPVNRAKVLIMGHEEEEPVLKIDYAQMEEEEEEAPVSEEEAVAAVEAAEEKPEEEKAAEGEGEKNEGPENQKTG
jgi:large subunit ribosomal protein L25